MRNFLFLSFIFRLLSFSIVDGEGGGGGAEGAPAGGEGGADDEPAGGEGGGGAEGAPAGDLLNGKLKPNDPPDEGGAPAAPSTLDFSQIIDKDGNFKENWLNTVPEEMRTDHLKSFKTFPAFLQSVESAQKLIGKKGMIAPDAHSSPEAVEKFWQGLGKPESAEAYKIAAPEGLPESINGEELVKNFTQLAHAADMPIEKAEKFFNGYMEMFKENSQAQEAAKDQADAEALTGLKKEWGGAFGQQLDLANRVVRTYGIADVLKSKGLSSDVELTKVFAQIGAGMSEDKLISGEDSALIPANAKAEADKVLASDAYMNIHNPEHAEAVKKYSELMQQAYPEK